MDLASASSAAAPRNAGLSGWDDTATRAGPPGRERRVGDAADVTPGADEPAIDACLRAYHREAAGRLALAALCQHHGPLG